MSSPRYPARSAWNSQFAGCGISADRARREPPCPYWVAFPTSFPAFLIPIAVLSPAFSVYLTVTCEPSLIPFPASVVPSHVVLPVHLIACSVPSPAFTSTFLVPLSTCFTTPERTWTTSSSADASGTTYRQAKAKRQNTAARRLRIGMASSLRFWCALFKTTDDAVFANVVTKPD